MALSDRFDSPSFISLSSISPFLHSDNNIPDMQVAPALPLINAYNEWDPLKEVVVGVSEHCLS